MAAKMADYYKKHKKIFPETGKHQGFACKMLTELILEVRTSSLEHPSDAADPSEFDIFKMASRLVANKFYKPV